MKYKLQKHEADSEESFLGLGLMENNRRTWFDFASETPITGRTYADDLMFGLEFILERDLIYHKRSIYTSLDLLGDVGGLFDALKTIMSLLVSLYFSIFGDPSQSYLLRALFLKSPEET